MRHLNIMIKPVSDTCNINCEYCFYKDVRKDEDHSKFDCMTLETLEMIVRRSFAFATSKIVFGFHGGEPLLAGIEYYKAFFKLVNKHRKPGVDIEYYIQTNGLLINDYWVKLFKKNQVLIGLSIDGDQLAHDCFRCSYGGKGTFEQVIEGYKKLVKNKVDVNILQVIHQGNISRPIEMYDFYKSIGVKFLQVSPIIAPLGIRKMTKPFEIGASQLAQYLILLFKMWLEDIENKEGIAITYFEQIVNKLKGHQSLSCGLQGQCSIQTVIEKDGSVYPCDFYAHKSYTLGNIKDDSIMTLLTKDTSRSFLKDSEKLGKVCQKCKWNGLCLMSCRRYQEMFGKKQKNVYCQGFKDFLDEATILLEEAGMV